MYIACCPPSPNVLGGETEAPGGNQPETAGFISLFPNREMLNFKNSATASLKWASAMEIKVFCPKTHSCYCFNPELNPGRWH